MIDKIVEELKKRTASAKRHNVEPVMPAGNFRIAFIDGGQAEILKAVDFSLQKIRTACVIFNENKRESIEAKEFFLLVTSEKQNNRIVYKTKTFGDGFGEELFDPMDEKLRIGGEKADISSSAGIVRRIAELRAATNADADITVLDGSLRCKFNQEIILMNELKKKKICSLAKTSRNTDDNGECILSSLAKTETDCCWKYFLYKEGYNAYAVKLHPSSRHIFEFNCFDEDADRLIGALCANANDAVFPGYPYGLILADKIARVSEEEKERLLMQIRAKAGKDWKGVCDSLNVLNGHDILDRVI